MATSKPVLYDMPVSNNGARNRLVLYWKVGFGGFFVWGSHKPCGWVKEIPVFGQPETA
jgi:hypothetical protein